MKWIYLLLVVVGCSQKPSMDDKLVFATNITKYYTIPITNIVWLENLTGYDGTIYQIPHFPNHHP